MNVDSISQGSVKQLDSLFRNAAKVCIVSHVHPDGDAVGSALGLQSYLKMRGVSAKVVLPTEWPDHLAFIAQGADITIADTAPETAAAIARESDLMVCLDVSSPTRTGCFEDAVRSFNGPKVLIDHHLAPEREFFSLVFSEIEVSSTCELLFFILLSLPDVAGEATRLPSPCATALMTGMTTDTNNFANSTFPSTLQMASSLLAAGVDRDAIITHIYNEYRENRVRAMAELLSRMTITPDGVAYMILDAATCLRLDIRDGETEGFVNIPLTIGKVRCSIFLREDSGKYRVSIRSRKGTSASRLAAEHFNGGGHELASGGRLEWPKDIASPQDAAAYIEDVTARFLHKDAAGE